MEMDTEGDVSVLYTFGDAVTTGTGGVQHDICRAVAWDAGRSEIAFMLEATSESLRPDFRSYNTWSGANSDITIITMKPGGVLTGGYNLNMWDASVSMGVGGNSFFVRGSDYIFGAQSFGYKTKYQNVTYIPTAAQLDSHVFKWDPQGGMDCFYTKEMSSTAVQAAVTGMPTGYNHAACAEKTYDINLFAKVNNLFLAYSSRYSGSFDLGDTMKYPKMCASLSTNMTDGLHYYRG
jgi:hypothetical protein